MTGKDKYCIRSPISKDFPLCHGLKMSNCYPVSTDELRDLLALWIAAEKAVTKGQNYSIEGVSVSRVDAELITKRISELSREICNRETAARGGRVGVMTPKWG